MLSEVNIWPGVNKRQDLVTSGAEESHIICCIRGKIQIPRKVLQKRAHKRHYNYSKRSSFGTLVTVQVTLLTTYK